MLPACTVAEGWKRSRRWRRRMGNAFAARGAILQRPRGMMDIIQDSLWGRKGGKKPVSAFFGRRERFGQSCCPVLTGGCPFGAGECPPFLSSRQPGRTAFFPLRVRADCGIVANRQRISPGRESYGTDSDRRSGGAGGYFGTHLRAAVPEGPRRNAHAELPHLGAAGGACAVCLGRISAGGPSAAEFKIKEMTKGGTNHALHCQRAPL